MIKCIKCGRMMEVVGRRTDNTQMELECVGCQTFWELKQTGEMDEDYILEVAQR